MTRAKTRLGGHDKGQITEEAREVRGAGRTAGGIVEDAAGVQLECAVVSLDGGGDLRGGSERRSQESEVSAQA